MLSKNGNNGNGHKPKMGRPRIELDAETFEGLCRIQCTHAEIANVMQVSIDTVENWCKRTYDETLSVVYKKHADKGKMSLRRSQFHAAENGNTTMMVWLGKQYLGQADKSEATITHREFEVDIGGDGSVKAEAAAQYVN